MSDAEKRRETRYRVRLRAAIVKGKDETVLQTEDVSYKGLFLRSDNPPALRSLLRVKVTLPPTGPDVVVHAMVVHVIQPGEGSRVPGAGLQFWGAFDPAQKKIWDDFIGELQRTNTATRRAIIPPLANTPDPVQRKHPRYPAEIKVKMSTVDELHTVYTRDISRGGMSIRTELEIEVSRAVKLRVVHPKTGETFPLEGIVRRRILQPTFRGLGLEIVGLDDARRAAFAAFIKGEIAELGDDDVEVVA